MASKNQNYATPVEFMKNDLVDDIQDIQLGLYTTSVIFQSYLVNIGDNSKNQLGVGFDSNAIEGTVLSGVIQVAPGDSHMCALQSTGKVYCWGQGSRGQLGNGKFDEQLSPVEVIW